MTNLAFGFHQYPHPHEAKWDSYVLHPILVIPSMVKTAPIAKTMNVLRRTPDYPENLHTITYNAENAVWMVNGVYALTRAILEEAVKRSPNGPTLHIYHDEHRKIIHSVECENIPKIYGLVNRLWTCK